MNKEKSEKSSKVLGVGKDSTPSQPKRYKYNYFAFRFTYEKVNKVAISGVLDKIKCDFSIFQLEQGANGQKHFQGCFNLKTRQTCLWCRNKFLTVFPELLFPKCDYLESKYKESCLEQLAQYCSKNETYLEGPWETGSIPGTEFKDDFELSVDDLPPLYSWQQKIVDRHAVPPPLFHPIIYWYWDPRGQIGKTMLARHLVLSKKAIYLQGAGRHIMATTFKNPSFWYVFGLPRSQENKISYQSLESLSDNLYMSGFGTEATGMVCRKTPWVIVFANFPPVEDFMSKGRWHVENLAETEGLYDLDSIIIPTTEGKDDIF
jgi:hypothetical protein